MSPPVLYEIPGHSAPKEQDVETTCDAEIAVDERQELKLANPKAVKFSDVVSVSARPSKIAAPDIIKIVVQRDSQIIRRLRRI